MRRLEEMHTHVGILMTDRGWPQASSQAGADRNDRTNDKTAEKRQTLRLALYSVQVVELRRGPASRKALKIGYCRVNACERTQQRR